MNTTTSIERHISSYWQSDPGQAYVMEEACLGSVIMAPDECLPHLTFLKPEHFKMLPHQYVYQAILDLNNRNEAVDLITLTDELRKQKRLLDAGGPAYLTELLNSVGSHVHVLTYANSIYEAWRVRKTFEYAGHIASAAQGSNTQAAIDLTTELNKMLAEGYRSANPLKQYLIRADELKNLPTVTWLVEGEIPERGLITLYGPSGVGKSFYALDIALRLAQQNPVVYIAAEGQAGYHQRVQAWCQHNKQSEGELYFFMRDVSISDETERKQFTDLIKELQPCLIVVDTLAEAMAGYDENSTRDMNLFLRATSRMKDEIGCAVMFVHHTSKAGVSERGNGSLRGSSDTMIRLVDQDDQIAVECSKQKDAEKFPTKYLTMIKIEIESGALIPVLIPDSQRERSATDPLSQNQSKVLKELGGQMMANGGSQSDLMEATGLPHGSLYYTLKRLLTLKHISRDGQMYHITEQGRGVLRDLGLLDYDPPQAPMLKMLNGRSTNAQPRIRQYMGDAQYAQSNSENFEQANMLNPVEPHEHVEHMSIEREKSSTRSTQPALLSIESKAPRKPCAVCGETNYKPDPTWGWTCRTCDQRRRQLDETAEVL